MSRDIKIENMKYLWLIFFLTVTLFVNGQKTEQIKGKWKFKDIADKDKIDSLSLKKANSLFSNTTMEFFQDSNYLYNSLKGTWALNKEENKLIVSIFNPTSPNDKKTSEWEIKGLTNKILKLDIGKFIIILERQTTESLTAKENPSRDNVKVSGENNSLKISIVALAENIKKQDLVGIKNVTKSAGVTSFSKFRGTAKRFNTNKYIVDSSSNYTSKEPIFTSIAPFYFYINQFDDGSIQVWYSLHESEVSPATDEIKKAGFKLLGKRGVFDLYSKDSIVITLPPIGSPSGGKCSLFLFNEKSNN